jgi:hypothetical protein
MGEEEHYDDTGFVIWSQSYQVKEGSVLTTEIINNVAVHNTQYQIDITAREPLK